MSNIKKTLDNNNLPLDFEEFLKSINDNSPINVKKLDKLIYKIKSYTGLDEKFCKIIVQSLFQEIKNEIVRGNVINIRSFGKFFIYFSNKKTNKKIVKVHLFSKIKKKFNLK